MQQPSNETSMMELSALVDGACDEQETSRALALWRQSAAAREAWRSYHLIGDVLRSPELAVSSDSEAFMQSLRSRLASEPVPLAPSAAAPTTTQGTAPARVVSINEAIHRRWGAPMAVAASFMALTFFGLSVLKPVGVSDDLPVAATSTMGAGLPSSALALQQDMPGLISLDTLSDTQAPTAPSHIGGVEAQAKGRSFDQPFAPPTNHLRPAEFVREADAKTRCISGC